MRKILIITLLILFILLILSYNKKENATDLSTRDSEAIQNISSLYNTLEKSAVFNNVKLGDLDVKLHLIPKGGIIMWSGITIPTGWTLCNGENGTPDLRGRFVVGHDPGASNKYDKYAQNIGDTGGSKQLYSLYNDYDSIVYTNTFGIGKRYNDTNIHKMLYNSMENRKLKNFNEFIFDRNPETNWDGLKSEFPLSKAKQNIGEKSRIFSTFGGGLQMNINVTRDTNGSGAWNWEGSTLNNPIYVMGDADERTTLPPYYVLAYIMKL